MKLLEMIDRLNELKEDLNEEGHQINPEVMFEDPRMGFAPVSDIDNFKYTAILIT